MDEKKLDSLLEIDDELKTDKKTTKRIEHGISKKIYKRVITVLLVIAMIASAGYLGYTHYVNNHHYNPLKEDEMLDQSKYHVPGLGFQTLMSIYMKMYAPDLIYQGQGYEVKKVGLAQYRTSGSFINLIDGQYKTYDSRYADPTSESEIEIDHSKFTRRVHTSSSRSNSYQYVDISSDDSDKFAILDQYDAETLIQDISELPDSTILDVSISFNGRKSLDEVCDFMKQYPTADFTWIAFNMVYNSSEVEGMSIIDANSLTMYPSPLSLETYREYPDLYLQKDAYLNGNILKKNYLANLKILMDHPDFLALFDMDIPEPDLVSDKVNYNDFIEDLKKYNISARIPQRYEEALENDPTSIGVRGIVKKSDVIDIIQSEEVVYVSVNDVKLSFFDK